MLESNRGIADCMAVHRIIKPPLALVLVLLIEDMRQSACHYSQRKAGNAREQNCRLVQALVQEVVQHRA